MNLNLSEEAIPQLEQSVGVAGSVLGNEQLDTAAPIAVGIAVGVGIGIYLHIN